MKLKSWKEIPLGGKIVNPGNSANNKTGFWSSKKPAINHQECIKCKQCVASCPEQCMALNEEKNQIAVDDNYCKGCGVCAEICPKKAIVLE
jgi:pyruvate ferredoxin oxidoreductase delta subunit